MYPERFSSLPPHAFARLRALLDHHTPGGDVVHMTIGEPKHPFPPWVQEILAQHASGYNAYPSNEGIAPLREAVSGWLARRFGAACDPETRIAPLNGTREGLFNAALALCPERKNGARPVVLMPNPFYQVYVVAAQAAGAQPVLVPATRESGYLPDFTSLPDDILERTALCYACSPSNPQGAVADADWWRGLLKLAERHDFKVFSDECYSEIYRDTPPPGALEFTHNADPERVLVFHSLSKRSNLPGLRSGFVAGGRESISHIRQLRAYGGAPLPLPVQHASAAVWSDEAHVVENRALYCEKYAMADEIFGDVPGYTPPQAGFFLWLPVADGEAAALRLWQETGVRVLPGGYLAREIDGHNPGAGYIRVALVAPADTTRQALRRLRACLYS